uniref:Integrin beta n=1 Tax=Petromyzon marinus TaxID=7757 RepID=A0AAJ7TDF3_PETMA|nr:integrin beta-5-like [Petromyzon marinus]
MLGDALNENNIKLIFAVSRPQYELYQNYSKLIPGSTAAVLETKSHIVPSLILNMYREFTSQLELIGDLQDLSIAVSETCQGKAKAGLEQCQEDDDEDTIRFNISLEAMGCPSMQPHRTLVVKPRGFLHSLLLSVHITCSGDPCDQTPPPRDSANIGGALTAQVGARLITQELERGNCSPTTKDGSEKPDRNTEQLPRTVVDDRLADVNCPASSGLLCSGRGVCHIGTCQCHKGCIGGACQRAWSPARGRSSSSSDAIPLRPSRTDARRDCVECWLEKREMLCARSVKITFLDHLSGCPWPMPWLRTFTAVCAGVVALGLLPFFVWKTVVTIVDCRRTPWTRQPVPPRSSTDTSSTFRNRTFLLSEMQMTPGI